MATNPHVASVPVAAPLPPLSLRQILLVHLIIFQEAVFGYHVHEFKIVQWIQEYSQTSFPICVFERNKDSDPKLPDMARIIADRVYQAWIMWNQCDTFCAITQPFVDRHLAKLLGLSDPTKWRCFLVIPELLLVLGPADVQKQVGHSVLFVTDGHGEKHIFDSTIDQYGRDWKTNWLMTENALTRSHLDLLPVPCFRRCFGEDEAALRAKVKDVEYQHGYWAVASIRMEQIFQELDWMSLHECVEEDIEARIRSLSKAKFAGALPYR